MKIYETEIEIKLSPFNRNIPKIAWGIDNVVIEKISLSDPISIKISRPLTAGPHTVDIILYNKLKNNLELGVIIDYIKVEKFKSLNFFSTCKFFPNYYRNNLLDEHQKNEWFSTNNITQNGKFQFAFNVPIFEWIHRTENLGWIFD